MLKFYTKGYWMRNEGKLNKTYLLMLTVLLSAALVCCGLGFLALATGESATDETTTEDSAENEPYIERSAIISSDGTPVNVRKGPGTSYGYVSGSLADKTPVTIIGEEMASDGSKWYKIRYTYNDQMLEGYMHSTYLIYDNYSGIAPEDLPSFEELLQDFPDSYHDALLALYDMYPSWKFVAVDTGLEWSEVLDAESENWRSLVSTSAISSWKSTIDEAYDWNTSTWYGLDGPKWVMASEGIVAHYLDPRNYLNGSMVFAFIAHAYDAEAQTIEGVKAIMAGTFMEEDFVENGQTYSYAEILMEAAEKYKVSPYVLAASIRLEIGVQGESASISGTEEGYEGLYNYYNVGAYATATLTANQRGLWWAAGAGTGATTYGRPWDSRYKAILGGAEYYAANYVTRGQNTLYLKRFNVTSTDTYNHQYMTNIQGAASEAHAYSRAYNAEAKMQNLVFYIPVYENMPETPCEKPTKTGSPNNKLDSITINGSPIAGFDMNTNEYIVKVDAAADKITLGVAPKDSTAVITGTGEVEVAVGENVFTFLVTAQNGDERTYTLKVSRPEDSALGSLELSAGVLSPAFDSDIFEYTLMTQTALTKVIVNAAARHPEAKVEVTGGGADQTTGSVIRIKVTAKDGVTTSEYKIAVEYVESAKPTFGSESFTIGEDNYITGISGYPLTKEAFMANLAITHGTYEVYAADGETALENTTNVGTGAVVKVFDRYGELYATYTVLIYGDVSGDGALDALDMLMVQKHLQRLLILGEINQKAADVSHDENVDALDMLMIQKHLMKIYEIGQ